MAVRLSFTLQPCESAAEADDSRRYIRDVISAAPESTAAPEGAAEGCRISLHAVTMTPDQAEPQQSTAEEDERGGFWHRFRRT